MKAWTEVMHFGFLATVASSVNFLAHDGRHPTDCSKLLRMTSLGNHVKFQVSEEHRDRVRTFYLDVLGWSAIPAPAPNLMLFQTPHGEVVGVFFLPAGQAPTEAQHLAGTWLEIMTDDVEGLLAKLRAAGVREIEYFDKTHVYFHSPGGPVFRLSPESERGPQP